MIEKLAEKYKDSVPDGKLVKYVYAAFPVYKVHLNITLLKKKEIGIVEEFVLKLLDINIDEIEKMSNILGIETRLITDSIALLFKDDLVVLLNERPKITDKGKEVLRNSKLIVPEQVSFHFLIDGFTGKALPHKASFSAKEVRKKDFHVLLPDKEIPNLNEISFNDVARLLKKHKSEFLEDTFNGDLISINNIEKSYTMYKKRSLLVFLDKNNNLDVKVFDGLDREVEYENILLKMQEAGISQIPFDKKDIIDQDDAHNDLTQLITDEVIKQAEANITENKTTQLKESAVNRLILEHENLLKNPDDLPEEEVYSKTQEIKILKKQLDDIKLRKENSTRFIETYEHRSILINALKKAKKMVIILSPWIRFSGFDNELQNEIINSLKRGIRVIIGYGIDEKDDSDPRAIEKLNHMKKQSYGKKMIFKKLGNTHEKVLLVDGEYVVITSFNWLSFRGNPNWGFRQESGIYTENEETINQVIISVNERMEIQIENYLK
ncbi:phospholipase D-like domain-containing protein [Lysinibacillus antri]|uniref:PLD phosphodiesterase domain-containing protein n=1 Tax=Lysinibacillus antri TaxID=2498145 RepID=A0A3S0R591_9BACI|nr:phospholipase D-like domain-containing protein [Lysinibacillus antri]RUL49912.1 hypothetical protein EK386_14655 [Lysinibacillus antri]